MSIIHQQNVQKSSCTFETGEVRNKKKQMEIKKKVRKHSIRECTYCTLPSKEEITAGCYADSGITEMYRNSHLKLYCLRLGLYLPLVY